MPDEVKKQTLTRNTSTVNKQNVTTRAREEHALERQVKALKELPQEPIGTAKKQAKASEQRDERLAVRLNAMVVENRRLAYSTEMVKKDLEKFQELAARAQAEVTAAREEKEVAVRDHLEAERTIKRLQTQNKHLESQLAANNAVLKESGRASFLTADTVSAMISDLADQLSDAMSGLDVKDIELKLKVAFGGAGEKRGFILPTAENGPEIKDSLNEVVIRFDRSRLES